MKDVVVSVLGLGYVGLPVAVAMAKKFKVIGFDIKSSRVSELKKGIDSTKEIEPSELIKADLFLTENEADLKGANFHIVTVPTPIDDVHQPDLTAIRAATNALARQLKKGDCIVYESTVYPGLTEEICVPILEKISGLKYKIDFKVGYSPERINPGDMQHRFETIKKVVSGCDAEALEHIANVYGAVVTAGIFKASSIAVAEAAKVIENTQRDINIALMNELAMIFDRIGIDTVDVLEAAGTKWNFLPFRPGLVGGHCIGVDPYYLTHKAAMHGYRPQVILSGRGINDAMGPYCGRQTIKKMIAQGFPVKDQPIIVLGMTFKEDVPDIRNSKVIDVINEMKSYGCKVYVHDPIADSAECHHEYGIELTKWEDLPQAAAMVMAVSHSHYKSLPVASLCEKLVPGAVITDIKSMLNRDAIEKLGFRLWRL